MPQVDQGIDVADGNTTTGSDIGKALLSLAEIWSVYGIGLGPNDILAIQSDSISDPQLQRRQRNVGKRAKQALGSPDKKATSPSLKYVMVENLRGFVPPGFQDQMIDFYIPGVSVPNTTTRGISAETFVEICQSVYGKPLDQLPRPAGFIFTGEFRTPNDMEWFLEPGSETANRIGGPREDSPRLILRPAKRIVFDVLDDDRYILSEPRIEE